MYRHITLWALVLFTASLFAQAAPASPATERDSLINEFKDKLIILKNPQPGKKLTFNEHGEVQGQAQQGVRGVDDIFFIESVRLSDDSIKFKGERGVFEFLDGKPHFLITGDPLEVIIHTGTSGKAALRNTFLAVGGYPDDLCSLDGAAQFADYLARKKPRGEEHDTKPRIACMTTGSVAHIVILAGMTPPRGIKTPDPHYDEQSRRAKQQGTVKLAVRISEQGKVSDMAVIEPLTPNLTVAAVGAVSKWEFKPAEYNGQPVAALVEIEVNFRLY